MLFLLKHNAFYSLKAYYCKPTGRFTGAGFLHMDKRQLLLDSVKKLLALHASDGEIIDNLHDVGIKEDLARELLKEAKSARIEKETEEEVKKDSGKVMMEVAETLTKTVKEAEKEAEKEAVPEKEKKAEKNPVKETHVSVSKLWEKGIIVTVNQRLEEIKKLKAEIDSAISLRAAELFEAEKKKQLALMESQRTLLSEKINSRLEEKEKEITQVIDLKIGEMRALNEQIRKNILVLEQKEQLHGEMLKGFESKEKELKELRNSLVSGMNSELMKSKSEAEEFLEKAQKKLDETDERMNKTLELESKIVEGLIEDAKRKIYEETAGKGKELEKEMRMQLQELQDFREEFVKSIGESTEKINERIKLLNTATQDAEEQINLRIRLIDEKIGKLDEFTKKVAKILGVELEKLAEKKKN